MDRLELIDRLKEKFSTAVMAQTQFLDETTIHVQADSIVAILVFLKNSEAFDALVDLTAVDYLAPQNEMKIVYQLQNSGNYKRLRVVAAIERKGSISSITSVWEGADWYEREVYDLFGVHFNGHIDLKRILLPDDWQGHPLCRDYALTEESVEFKHGVEPKVPSEIIHIKRKQKME